MHFRPTITFEQYRNTCQAVVASKDKRVQHRSWKEYVVLGIACLVLGLAPQVPVARVPVFTLYAVGILCWIFSKPLAKRSQEKCLRAVYSEEQEMLNAQVLTISESGISCDRVNGQVTSHYTWQAFIKRIDMPDAFVFLPSPNSFVRVPKEMLSSSECELIWQWSSTVPNCSSGGNKTRRP
ncbi:MAG TPA: hypothetical protein VJX73_14655 [Terracidiphilus sp.]|nr:hypothetical protein [Terracidiphilus sp.]